MRVRGSGRALDELPQPGRSARAQFVCGPEGGSQARVHDSGSQLALEELPQTDRGARAQCDSGAEGRLQSARARERLRARRLAKRVRRAPRWGGSPARSPGARVRGPPSARRSLRPRPRPRPAVTAAQWRRPCPRRVPSPTCSSTWTASSWVRSCVRSPRGPPGGSEGRRRGRARDPRWAPGATSGRPRAGLRRRRRPGRYFRRPRRAWGRSAWRGAVCAGAVLGTPVRAGGRGRGRGRGLRCPAGAPVGGRPGLPRGGRGGRGGCWCARRGAAGAARGPATSQVRAQPEEPCSGRRLPAVTCSSGSAGEGRGGPEELLGPRRPRCWQVPQVPLRRPGLLRALRRPL